MSGLALVPGFYRINDPVTSIRLPVDNYSESMRVDQVVLDLGAIEPIGTISKSLH